MSNSMFKVELKALISDKRDVINVKKIMGAIRGAAVEIGRGMRADFEKTTRTWKHKPIFTIKIATSGEALVSVFTDNQIYIWVSGGTKPHMIRPRNAKVLAFNVPFQAKTRVRWIGSRNGMKGKLRVYSKGVKHPGTEAREYDQVVYDIWQPKFELLMERRINNAVDARS